MIGRSTRFIIALVDDDHRVLESLKSLLESADYRVLPFMSATALVESGCLEEIHCLISDIDMPVMDGFELLRVARVARPGLPVLLVTGRPELLKRLSPEGAGSCRSLIKPLDGQELLAAVHDALLKSRQPGTES